MICKHISKMTLRDELLQESLSQLKTDVHDHLQSSPCMGCTIDRQRDWLTLSNPTKRSAQHKNRPHTPRVLSSCGTDKQLQANQPHTVLAYKKQRITVVTDVEWCEQYQEEGAWEQSEVPGAEGTASEAYSRMPRSKFKPVELWRTDRNKNRNKAHSCAKFNHMMKENILYFVIWWTFWCRFTCI